MMMTREQINRFVALGYATDAFKFARFNCATLMELKDDKSLAWLSGVTSLVTHYARPFKRSKGVVALEADFVPAAHRQTHSRLIEARDKAHAHLDGDLKPAEAAHPLHRLRLLKETNGAHYWLPSRVLLLEANDLPSISSLLDDLLLRLNQETDELEKWFLPAVGELAPGLYFLNAAEQLFTPDNGNSQVQTLGELGPIN